MASAKKPATKPVQSAGNGGADATAAVETADTPTDLAKFRLNENPTLASVRADEDSREPVRDDTLRETYSFKYKYSYEAPAPQDGMVQMWILTKDDKGNDVANVARAQEKGWKVRPSDTLSEQDKIRFVQFSNNEYDSVIRKHNSVLMERPVEISRAELDHYVQMDRERLERVNSDVVTMLQHAGVEAKAEYEISPLYQS